MSIQTNQDLYSRLWDGANQLRGSMEASKYKDYMLGIMFYKFLSDKTLQSFAKSVEINDRAYETYMQYADDDAIMAEIYKALVEDLGYYVQPNDLYQTWLKNIENNTFELASVEEAFNNFQRNIQSSNNRNDFEGLFSSLNVNSQDLGSNLKDRNNNIASLIKLFADMDMAKLQQSDVLGDAYEYLVGQFGMESGKKAGEFYTPHQVSEVMAQIVTNSTQSIRSIYDPAVGSGSLLLTVAKHLTNSDQKVLQYFGQEKITATYNLTRMNLLLHGVQPDHMTINNGDTLKEDWPEDPDNPQQSRQFDAVVMNPPYSYNWNAGEDSAYSHASLTDPRFQDYEALAPKTKADYAFLLHGLYHLDQEGTMAIVLPHGVLFRGGDEGTIRQNLLKKNQIHAIIGLPANLFTNTGIPVIIMVLKKNRVINNQKDVLIIDASDGFVKEGKQNQLRERDIAEIVDAIKNRQEVSGFSHLATLTEIEQNDFNLNIPRYVEKIEVEDVQDVEGHLQGGIPQRALQQLTVLNALAKDELHHSFTEIRPGYFKQTIDNEQLRQRVYQAPKLVDLQAEIKEAVTQYEDTWFNKLTQISADDSLETLKSDMNADAKDQLASGLVDAYAAYQVAADLWRDNLTIDTEIIQKVGVLTAGQSINQLYKTKKKNNQTIQVEAGQEGALLPKSLVQKYLFGDELAQLNRAQEQVAAAESQLAELIEDGQNNEDFDGLIFEDKQLMAKKDRVKIKDLNPTADADARQWLKDYDSVEKAKRDYNKKVTELQNSLDEKTLACYPQLSELQIAAILKMKWFADFPEAISRLLTNLVDQELARLKRLRETYSETLADIQTAEKETEAEFMALASQLIVGNPDDK